jgi:hypothetical protein
VATTTRFLLRQVLAQQHVHKKLKALMEPGDIGTVHYESTLVCTDDEISLFEILFLSGHFIPSTVSRAHFLDDLLTDPRQLFLRFSSPKTKASNLGRLDFKAMQRWWNGQVLQLHGSGEMLAPPAFVPGNIEPSFTDAELASLSKICAANLLLKNEQFLRLQAVNYAGQRVAHLATAAGAPGLAIETREVSQEVAAARSMDFADVVLFNQSTAAGSAGSIAGK